MIIIGNFQTKIVVVVVHHLVEGEKIIFRQFGGGNEIKLK